jgi:phytoene desaturase
MMACPSVTSPALAPAGGASIQLSAIVPNLDHPVDWAAQRAALRETLLARMERALPGSRAEIVEELEIAPPQWRDSFRVERGAVFSFAHDNQQVGSFRPHNRSKKLRNLYWVGGGTHPGSGIFPILLSSVIADDLIAEDGIGRKPPPWRLQVAG